MRCGYAIWATDIGDLYDRIQQGRGQSVPLRQYINAMRDGNPDRRSSIKRVDGGKLKHVEEIDEETL